ncbi:UNKNOWN [Stylonychia lemnae]|uniref:Uncharacterized protein n=1 Tax=Stylonychia lemnae TaxID=5949 RepID=A0A078A251_STYLE|nr:UNKNOWN [Stylonychia lemnae]|eukprot:CDW75902.1 UNKNOWN [Stylonychia lemnae]
MSFQNQTSTSRKQAITTHTDLKLKIKDKFTYEQTIDFMDKIVNSMKKKRHYRLKKFQPVYVNLPLIKNTYEVGLGGKNEQQSIIKKENIKSKRSRNISELKSETIKLKEIARINNSENITDDNTQTNFRADQQWQQPSNISRNQQGMMNHYHSQLNKTVSLEQNNSQFYLNQMKQEHKVNEKVTRRFLRQVTDEHQNSDEFQTPIIGITLFIESEQFNEQNSNQQRELKKVRIKSNTNRFKNSNLDYNQRSKSFDKGKEIGKQQKSKQNELIYAVDKFQPSEDLILFQSNPKQIKETTRTSLELIKIQKEEIKYIAQQNSFKFNEIVKPFTEERKRVEIIYGSIKQLKAQENSY